MVLDETDDIDQPGIDWNRVDWFDLVPRLVLIASHRLRIAGLDPNATSATDIVHDAILKAINGSEKDQQSKMQPGFRRWKPENCSLLQFLSGIIKSDISNLCEKRKKGTLDKLSDMGLIDEKYLHSHELNPEEEYINKTNKEQLIVFLESKDKILAKIALMMIEDSIISSKEIGSKLKLRETEINNAKKRLRRFTREFIDTSKHNNDSNKSFKTSKSMKFSE